MCRLAIALVHYPIYNRHGEVITSSITTFDLHDLARLARTYNLWRYFVVHPYASQREVAGRIIRYWKDGLGGQINPDRREAMSTICVVATLEEACASLLQDFGLQPWKVYTDARDFGAVISFVSLRHMIKTRKSPCLLVFGTGWGIERSQLEQEGRILQPIGAGSDYNHLSVRSAAGIVLDRIFRLH